ncbi:MAG: large repetitive protein, partial [Pseudonocardiales bacterium]|nr:large repetitive protein [Pseudonocardiales bacterium]
SDAPTSDAPTSDAPSSATGNSATPTSATPATSVPKKGARVKVAAVGPDYGTRKVYRGVQLKDGSYVTPGLTTAGSTITAVETGPDAPVGPTTCTTAILPGTPPGTTQSACDFVFSGYQVQAGDTVTFTQTGAPAGLVADTQSITFGPCLVQADPNFPDIETCPPSQNATFTDTGPLPEAVDDSYTVRNRRTSNLDVYSNDDTHGAPPTSVDVVQPAHGTVTVEPDAVPLRLAAAATTVTGPFHLAYTPNAGYVGADPFSYTLTTGNGSSAANVSLTVLGDPPTAKDDAASTKAGDPVTVQILGNDAANGGGTLSLKSVGHPKHGTARIDGTAVVYTPADGFSGTDAFTYTVATASGTDTATVRITVSAAPTSSPASSSGNIDTNAGTADTGTPTAALVEIAGGLLLAGAGATFVGRHRRPRGRNA